MKVIVKQQPAKEASCLKTSVKVLLLCLIGIMLGFLIFFPLTSMSHVHVMEVAGLGHRGAAFCAFTKACQSHEDLGHHSGVFNEANQHIRPILLETKVEQVQQPQDSNGGSSTSHLVGGMFSTGTTGDSPNPEQEQATNALRSRVCGSPAVDGYAHVNNTCLELSPTSQWYLNYYKKGGRQGNLEVHFEEHSSYDGVAVAWGMTNKKKTAQECAAHCSSHMPGDIPGPGQNLPCNVFVFCPNPECWEPDAHHSTFGDCWLKFAEGPANPEVNVRGDIDPKMRARHPEAPARVDWTSGVLLPTGVALLNGTWSPRKNW